MQYQNILKFPIRQTFVNFTAVMYMVCLFYTNFIKKFYNLFDKRKFLSRKFWTEIFLNKISTFPVVPYQLEILKK